MGRKRPRLGWSRGAEGLRLHSFPETDFRRVLATPSHPSPPPLPPVAPPQEIPPLPSRPPAPRHHRRPHAPPALNPLPRARACLALALANPLSLVFEPTRCPPPVFCESIIYRPLLSSQCPSRLPKVPRRPARMSRHGPHVRIIKSPPPLFPTVSLFLFFFFFFFFFFFSSSLTFSLS